MQIENIVFRVLASLFKGKINKKKVSQINSTNYLTKEMILSYKEGLVLLDKKLYEEALQKFDFALQSGIYKHAYLDRGICLQMLNYHVEAIEDFTNALDLVPEDCNIYYLRSLSEEAIGDYDNALQDAKPAKRRLRKQI
jgi:tetratricopeptide (TPR) repeat protein